MRRRIARNIRLDFEEVERRELLSAITDIMASNSLTLGRGSGSAAFSSQSIATLNNQGPLITSDGTINNQALAPTGTLTPSAQRKERFTAKYVGTYTVGRGQTSGQLIRTFITGVGSTNTILHSDIQLLLVTPSDPTQPIGGVTAIFDRNLNSNTVLGLDLAAPQTSQYINRSGLPSFLPKVSVDLNISSGVYDEAYSVGTISIHYIPNGKHTAGVLSQGTAIVTIHAQIYAPNVDFILRNAHINP